MPKINLIIPFGTSTIWNFISWYYFFFFFFFFLFFFFFFFFFFSNTFYKFCMVENWIAYFNSEEIIIEFSNSVPLTKYYFFFFFFFLFFFFFFFLIFIFSSRINAFWMNKFSFILKLVHECIPRIKKRKSTLHCQ